MRPTIRISGKINVIRVNRDKKPRLADFSGCCEDFLPPSRKPLGKRGP